MKMKIRSIKESVRGVVAIHERRLERIVRDLLERSGILCHSDRGQVPGGAWAVVVYY